MRFNKTQIIKLKCGCLIERKSKTKDKFIKTCFTHSRNSVGQLR